MEHECNCEAGFTRCPIAELLWREANNIYYSQGYDAWINSHALTEYQEHMKAVYDHEHYALIH